MIFYSYSCFKKKKEYSKKRKSPVKGARYASEMPLPTPRCPHKASSMLQGRIVVRGRPFSQGQEIVETASVEELL